jgi:hypothetical protein
MAENPPSIKETAFDCPHCGAYTTQFWYELVARSVDGDPPLPFFVDGEEELGPLRLKAAAEEKLTRFFENMKSGLPFFEEAEHISLRLFVRNLSLSKCYRCKKLAVWVSDRVLFPPRRSGVTPNPDLPDDIVRDFEEARSIVDLSPRGAAGLLRLCIQKLCTSLGEKGKNIDDDIASLVSKGLSPLVQKSLDIVRVTGNEAVHPGVMDLRDDRDTAQRLFGLVNLIAEQMISIPRHVKAVYDGLPASKRERIEARDKKKGSDVPPSIP